MSSLGGARILVTRPAHQAENLSRLIAEHDGFAVRFPVLEIVAVSDNVKIQKTLAELDKFQWIFFISTNAVTMLNYYLDGGKMPKSESVRYAAIGLATSRAMREVGLSVDLVPENSYNSEALLAMPEMQQVNGKHCLVIRGEGGREELAFTLRSRGAKVDYLDVYKRVIPNFDKTEVIKLLDQNKLDVITVSSAEILQNLLFMLGKENYKRLTTIPLIVVSDRIRQIAAELGFKQITVAESASDAAILDAVITKVAGD